MTVTPDTHAADSLRCCSLKTPHHPSFAFSSSLPSHTTTTVFCYNSMRRGTLSRPPSARRSALAVAVQLLCALLRFADPTLLGKEAQPQQ
jgi:hypothetical protein